MSNATDLPLLNALEAMLDIAPLARTAATKEIHDRARAAILYAREQLAGQRIRFTVDINELGDAFPTCSDGACELDSSVFITEPNGERKAWCTGHAHCEIALMMVGL